MAGHSGGNGKTITGINVTPLVDIVLVLLIIFMATAHFMSNRAIKMTLPKAANSETRPTPSLQVSLARDGSLHLDNRALTRDELILNLSQTAKLDPSVRVSVAADEQVSWGEVSAVLDDIRGCGISRIGAEVQPKESKTGR